MKRQWVDTPWPTQEEMANMVIPTWEEVLARPLPKYEIVLRFIPPEGEVHEDVFQVEDLQIRERAPMTLLYDADGKPVPVKRTEPYQIEISAEVQPR